MPFHQAALLLGRRGIVVRAERRDDYGFNGQGLRGAIGGVQFAEVAVDVETGMVKVERVVAVQDCGRPVNPLGLENQVNGGILQGISWALLRIACSTRGPGACRCESGGVQARGRPGGAAMESSSWRSTGPGAPPTRAGSPSRNIATAAAIANAVHNAIGVRVRELPNHPEAGARGAGTRARGGS